MSTKLYLKSIASFQGTFNFRRSTRLNGRESLKITFIRKSIVLTLSRLNRFILSYYAFDDYSLKSCLLD